MSSGQVAPTQVQAANPGNANINATAAVQNNPQLAAIMQKIGSGSLNYNDAIAQIQGMQFNDGNSDQRTRANSQVTDAQAALDNYNKGPASSQQYNGTIASGGMAANNGLSKQVLENNLTAAKNAASAIPGFDSGLMSSAAIQQLFSNPLSGGKIASSQVMDNPLNAGLFGEKGLEGRAQGNYNISSDNLTADRNSLMGRDSSYGLTPEDLEAYGQESGSIARQFGQSGNNLAAMLSNQGLSSSSAPTAQLYSGLLGNQNEQLAASQMKIAQQRIQTAQGLAQARTNADLSEQAQSGSLAANLGQLGAQEYQNQYLQNTGGQQMAYNQSMGANNANIGNYVAGQGVANEAQAAANQAQGPGLGSIVAGIVGSAAPVVGSALTKPASTTYNIGKT